MLGLIIFFTSKCFQVIYEITFHLLSLIRGLLPSNPTALRTVKTQQSSGHSEFNRAQFLVLTPFR